MAAGSQTDTLPLLGAMGEDDLILGTSDPSTVLLSLCKIPPCHTPAKKKTLGWFLVNIVKCVTAEKKDPHVKSSCAVTNTRRSEVRQESVQGKPT